MLQFGQAQRRERWNMIVMHLLLISLCWKSVNTDATISPVTNDTTPQKTTRNKVPEFTDKSDRPIVSYIGDSVVLKCKAKQTPNTWQWFKGNGTEKIIINATTDPTHYNIFLNNDTTKLTLLNLTEEDAGNYTCSAVFDIKFTELQLELKVLSFTEPLKPFIGIAVEVIILVTLILLYEKYRNKNKGHLETTENGLYENTPTQEENTSEDNNTTTRQRKVEH